MKVKVNWQIIPADAMKVFYPDWPDWEDDGVGSNHSYIEFWKDGVPYREIVGPVPNGLAYEVIREKMVIMKKIAQMIEENLKARADELA